MAASLETELKLRADEVALRSLAAMKTLGSARLGPMREVDETDVYLDTADRRLGAARWACRLRLREGRRLISLKGPAEHAAGDALHRRPEVEGPGPAADREAADPRAWPPSAARDLARRLAGEAPLEERLTLRQHRAERRVTVDGRRVALMSLDRVRVERRGAPLGELRVVELELLPGMAETWLPEVSDALQAMPGLQLEPASKLERALELVKDAELVEGTEPAEGASGEAR